MTLWGFWKRWDTPFEVSTTLDRRPKGIKVHRSQTLTRLDLTTQLGIRVTTPARTLDDMSARLDDRAFKRAVNGALLSRFLTRDQLAAHLQRHPNPRLTPFAETTDGPTRSVFEDEFVNFCERYGLPKPQINAIVGGREVDAYFPVERLIVELDSWEFHSDRDTFEGDRDQDADGLVNGIPTFRLTWERMTGRPDFEAARLEASLARRRPA